jgi:hypothetical protein
MPKGIDLPPHAGEGLRPKDVRDKAVAQRRLHFIFIFGGVGGLVIYWGEGLLDRLIDRFDRSTSPFSLP